MQWANMVKFSGKVKTAGIDKSMSWKLGTVDFDYDTSSNTWQVKLYLNVDRSKSIYDMKISHPDMLELKCGRMMIENKKGDGIHIKLDSWDVENAKKLVTKIKSSISSTPKHYRAEVGLAASSTLSNRKGSENVSPFLNGSLSSSESSPYISSVDMSPVKSGWLSKKNPPPSARVNHENHSHNTSKRKLEYSHQDRQKHKGSIFNSEDRQSKGMSLNSNDDREDSASFSSSRFTGVKDHSKRSLQGGNGLSVTTNGLGAKSFYGAQNSLIADNTYKGLSRSFNGGNKPSSDRSPQVKRPRLSYPPSYSSNNNNNNNNNNKMGPSLGLTAGPAESSKKPVENSDHDDYLPVRQRMDGQTVGFENLGNTCFMNSPLQCLSSLEPLSLDIQSAMVQYGSYLKPNSMTRLLYLLMKDVRKLDVNPARVTEILTRLRRENINKFAANTQQDAHELLCELLDRVDEEVKKAMEVKAEALSVPAVEGAAAAASSSEETSEAEAAAAPSSLPSQRDLLTPTKVNFHWFFKTSFYFHECKTEVASSKEECEMTLMLPLDSTTVNIQDCVDKYFQSSVVDMRCERCGKNEKATMIRKIVRRPRIFILNLLRYHTDNSESKKRLDQINIPSYMTIAEYCADDVKAPPPMEAVFMLDRISSSNNNNSNNNNNGNRVSFAAEAEILNGQPHIPAITQLKEAELKYSANKEKEGSTRTEGKKHGQDTEESESEVSEAVKRHVEKLIDGFCELDRSLEMMQDMGDDMSEFYNKVQDIISEVTAFIESTFLEVANEGEEEPRASNGHRPEHQLLLCHTLLHRALAEETDHSDSDSPVVAKEILNTHYISIQGETRQVDHLIQDLGKYLAAQKLNILKPDTPQKSSTGTLTNGHNDTEGIDSDQEVTFPKKETQQRKKGFDAQKGLEQFDEIMSVARKMEEEQSRRRGYQKTAENGSVKPASEDFVNTKQPVEVEVDWDDECNNVERSRNLNSKQSVEVGDVYGITTQTLHGRDIGSYTQAELEQINLGSVTDAEMMLIAQTLSRLEYAKEQRVQREDPPDVLDGESSMEICSTGLECDETRDRSVDIKEDQSLDGYLTAEKSDGISAGSKSEEATLLQGTVNNKHLQDFEAKLHCDEELSDFDEPDGVRTGSKGGKTDSIRKTPPSGLNKKTRPLFPTPEHDPSSDVDESGMEEVCVVCGTSYTGECALCAPLDQADFGYQAFDAHLSTPVERLAQDKASENTSTSQTPQSSKVLSDKCNTVPNHDSSPENLTSAAAKTNREKSVKSAVTPEKKSPDQVVFPDSADKSLKNPAENVGDHVVPMSPLLSPRKELQLFSPSKPSNLVKSRDYARLRSPSASPKKRTNKLQSPKYGSASKRLHFPEGEKGEAKLKISPDKEGSDLNSESLSGASVEVNVDETSFLDGIDRYTFTPASLLSNTSTYSSPNHSPAHFSSSSSLTLSTSTPVSAPLPSMNVSTNGVYESTHQARSGSASSHPSVSEEATLQQLAVAPQINQSASAQDPQTDQSEPIKSRKPSHTELLQENTNPEKSSNFQKPKASRSLVENLSSAEEKENKRKDPARTKRLQQIEAGKADVSYRLVGIVDHIGESLFAGHYAAFAFNMGKNSWFSMDDKDTRKTTETTAKRESLESGYVFFYMDKELYQEYENKVAARLH